MISGTDLVRTSARGSEKVYSDDGVSRAARRPGGFGCASKGLRICIRQSPIWPARVPDVLGRGALAPRLSLLRRVLSRDAARSDGNARYFRVVPDRGALQPGHF